MSLTIQDVKRVAHLARIAVTEDEADDVLRKLTGIFALIEDMRKVDTTGIEPMSHAADVSLALRDDRSPRPIIASSISRRARDGGRALPGAEGHRMTIIRSTAPSPRLSTALRAEDDLPASSSRRASSPASTSSIRR
jgi:aspartyl-tRNA(Asn)/glutamyl-tRNA(Gln) amidotransferase subunit C